MAGNFAIPEVIEAARILEDKGRLADWEGARFAFDELCRAIGRVRPALEAFAAAPAS